MLPQTFAPHKSDFACGYKGFTPSSQARTLFKFWWDLRPQRPAPALIKLPLRVKKIYPVLADSDGVGFEPTVGLPLLLISSQVH